MWITDIYDVLSKTNLVEGVVKFPSLLHKFIINMITVIKVSATWCGPCKNYKPVFDEFKNTNSSEGIKFREIDVDRDPDFVGKYKIQSVPTTMFFKDDEVVKRVSGTQTLEALERMLEEVKG